MNPSSFWALCGASALLHVGLVWVAQAALGGPSPTSGPIDVELARSTILDEGSWAEGSWVEGTQASGPPAASPALLPRGQPELRQKRASASSSAAPVRELERQTAPPPAVATRAVAVAPELARFVLRSSDVPLGSGNAARAAQPVAAESQPVPEDQVSVRARLLSAGVVVYPPRARAAEIEADVRLEIVVDRSGRVSHARPLSRPGHGLEAAALAALRGYRFAPALLGDRPVQVRMLWTVQFRLR